MRVVEETLLGAEGSALFDALSVWKQKNILVATVIEVVHLFLHITWYDKLSSFLSSVVSSPSQLKSFIEDYELLDSHEYQQSRIRFKAGSHQLPVPRDSSRELGTNGTRADSRFSWAASFLLPGRLVSV